MKRQRNKEGMENCLSAILHHSALRAGVTVPGSRVGGPRCALVHGGRVGWEVVHQAKTRITPKMFGRQPKLQKAGAGPCESHRDKRPRRARQGWLLLHHGPVVAEAWQRLQRREHRRVPRLSAELLHLVAHGPDERRQKGIWFG